MSENQNIEWKSSWRDEYLKWICGFANATGGKLEIGKDDTGVVIGVADAKMLMEDLPNKIRNILGIIVDVNLHSESGKDWISIEVAPYPYPVSYKGQYHYRSGSTKQELIGAALDKFLLQKQGKRWDSVPVPQVAVDDLSADAFGYFRKKATQTKRLDNVVLQEDDNSLIPNRPSGKRCSTPSRIKIMAAAILFRSGFMTTGLPFGIPVNYRKPGPWLTS